MSDAPLHTFAIFFRFETSLPAEAKLQEEVKALGNWWHCLHSTWLVRTTLDIDAVQDRFRKWLRPEDLVLVIELQGAAAWAGFSGQSASWLKDNLLARGMSPQARGLAAAGARAAGH